MTLNLIFEDCIYRGSKESEERSTGRNVEKSFPRVHSARKETAGVEMTVAFTPFKSKTLGPI